MARGRSRFAREAAAPLRCKQLGVDELLRPIDGQIYNDDASFQRAVMARFNEHLYEFPPHYTYRDAISWAQKQGWLPLDDEGRLVISLPPLPRSEQLPELRQAA